MGTRRVDIGPAGEKVRRQVAERRKDLRLTLRDLSERMTASGWPMAHNTISEIENGGRRVDVDDLCALAKALEVTPGHLLGWDIAEELRGAAAHIARELLKQSITLRAEDIPAEFSDEFSDIVLQENDHGDD